MSQGKNQKWITVVFGAAELDRPDAPVARCPEGLTLDENPNVGIYDIPVRTLGAVPRSQLEVKTSIDRFLKFAAANPGMSFRVVDTAVVALGDFTSKQLRGLFTRRLDNVEFAE